MNQENKIEQKKKINFRPFVSLLFLPPEQIRRENGREFWKKTIGKQTENTRFMFYLEKYCKEHRTNTFHCSPGNLSLRKK